MGILNFKNERNPLGACKKLYIAEIKVGAREYCAE